MLFRVHGSFTEKAVEQVRKKFAQAWAAHHAIFVPGVCILEWGNHVARIGDAAVRADAALLLTNEVREALNQTQQQRKFTLIIVPDLAVAAAELTTARRTARLGHASATTTAHR